MKLTLLSLLLTALVVALLLLGRRDAPPNLADVLYPSDRASSLEQLELALDRGADVNAPVGFDRMLREGESPDSRVPTKWPLDVAVERSRLDMVTLLLSRGASLHGKELAAAALRGKADRLAMVTALLLAGADPNSTSDGFTALHWAAHDNDIELTKLLLSQRGIELDVADLDGDTPLLAAVQRGALEVAGMLLEAGARPGLKNRRGESATAQLRRAIDKQQELLEALAAAEDGAPIAR